MSPARRAAGMAIATLGLIHGSGCHGRSESHPDGGVVQSASPGGTTADAKRGGALSSRFKPEATARAELREFLSSSPSCGNDPGATMPRRIDPSLVEGVLRETVAAGR